MMTSRENLLRTVRFERPERIPVRFAISGACWNHYPQDVLQDLMEAHPLLFPDFKREPLPIKPQLSPWTRAGKPYTDSWGCVWEAPMDGLSGSVTSHPLASWDDFETYRPPDPDHDHGWGPVDWDEVAARLNELRERGDTMVTGSLRHGHTFLTLIYIRGYEATLYDMADENPNLIKLIGMIEDFNMRIVRHYLDIGIEWMSYPEDLGMQLGPMLSPEQFRKYIKPVYQRLMAPARKQGCIVHMHSDGDIRDLVDDLIDGGVEIVNLQDLVNGIDWIKDRLAGKVCIDLDVDRQKITRFGTPEDVDNLIRHEVETLGSPEGGLMMTHGLYPGIPLENVKALMDAFEKYMTHYA